MEALEVEGRHSLQFVINRFHRSCLQYFRNRMVCITIMKLHEEASQVVVVFREDNNFWHDLIDYYDHG